MLIENTLFGEVDKVKKAIDRLKAFEPEEGYYLCFSGGKDSQCIYHLAIESGVKFEAHYNLTTIDPPELVKFIKSSYKEVVIHYPELSMWKLILKNLCPPNRWKRYCCSKLKEKGGEGRLCVTGVRWAESANRKKRRPFEIVTSKKEDKKLFNDNDEGRKLFENCMQKGKKVVNPIIDWDDSDVWDYLNNRNIPHCELYDEGYKRIGCIACPLAGGEMMEKELDRWPIYKENYLRVFKKVIDERKKREMKCTWNTPEELMEWWLYGTVKGNLVIEGQVDIMDDEEIS